MSFFRSEPMSLCHMLLHKESAFDCLVELGYMGVVQFNSLSDPGHVPNLRFTSEMQRCSELQRIIRHLQTEIENAGMKMVFYDGVDEGEIPQISDMSKMDVVLRQMDSELNEVEVHCEALKKKRDDLYERWHVLVLCDDFLSGDSKLDALQMQFSDHTIKGLLRDETQRAAGDTSHRLSFYAGTIFADRFQSFELLIWRICRNTFYIKFDEIPPQPPDVYRPEETRRKYAFMVFFVGDVMREKILKVCRGYHVKLYECPESREERLQMAADVSRELGDIRLILQETDDHRRRILSISANDLFIWKSKITKSCQVYFILNRLEMVHGVKNQNYLQADCWVPTKDIPEVRSALFRGAKRFTRGDEEMMFPPILIVKRDFDDTESPTYFKLNKFTRGFQNIINAYGLPNYRELNPAPYTIITFPFLFAVMFGDIGHGLIMAIFAGWMVKNEKQIKHQQEVATSSNEIFDILFAGRYIILLMGVFSIYTGFIYNDIFSKSMNIFGSHWRVNAEAATGDVKFVQLNPESPSNYLGTPYIFGMDPVWGAAGENSITTFNSLKMKLAIILGITHMLFGLFLAAANYIFFKNMADLWLVWLPQVLFLISLFLYLVLLVFYKWCMYGGHNNTPWNTACAPSILITFIDMVLMKSSDEPPEGCEKTMYAGQGIVQLSLLIIAVICVPVLLCGKPLHFMITNIQTEMIDDNQRREHLRRSTISSTRKSLTYHVEYFDDESISDNVTDTEQNKVLSELWIHQGIHCIESVLGAVSHTASYLRLWALSLAHAQLSHVLWKMVLAMALTSDRGFLNSILLYVIFAFWAVLTVAILVVMEGLSAFLHTLRLHWVEFQSKFYIGTGEGFYPFAFEKSTLRN